MKCMQPQRTKSLQDGTDDRSGSDLLGRLLKDAQTRLLETGTRNRLIHVNRNAGRGNVVNLVNARSDDVFRIIVANRRLMSFAALGKDNEEDAPDAPAPGPADESRFVDETLETMLGPQALQKRLLKIARDAQATEQEQGVNILFLAVGFLKWFESENSNVQRNAPLLLIPVLLKRNARTAKHDVEFRDDDILTNLSLQERLKTDFGIILPEVPDVSDLSPSRYFDDVRTVISGQSRWNVDADGMQLGFFSFAKLLMMKDLDPANWPEGALVHHPLLNGLLARGFEGESPLFDENANLDDLFEPADLIQVVDADASQTKVIEEVRAGRNLVVQGPPGTGKSQTITNIIAAAVHDGKKVLFVAEKMAALSVVHKRLVEAGLRDVCIEFHSRSANKKAVLDELGKTLNAGRAMPLLPASPLKLKAVRDDLNACSALLHTPIGKTGVSPFEVLGVQARLIGRGAPPPAVQIAGIDEMDRAQADRLIDAAARMAKWVEAHGPPLEHPFAGVGRLDFQPLDLQRIVMNTQPLAQHCRSLAANLDKVAALLGLAMQASFRNGAAMRAALDHAAICPTGRELGTVSLLLQSKRRAAIKEALKIGMHWREAASAAEGVFSELAWSIDPAPMRAPLAAGAASFLARMGGAYRNASTTLAGAVADSLPKAATERLALADTLLMIRARRRDLVDVERLLEQELGAAWRGEKTDFAGLAEIVDWCDQVEGRGLGVDPVRLAQVCAKPELVQKAMHAIRHLDAVQRGLDKVRQTLHLDVARGLGAASVEDAPIHQVAQKLETMIAEVGRYGEWVEFYRCDARLRESGAAALVERLTSGALGARSVEAEIKLCRAEAIWRRAIRERPQLAEQAPGRRRALVEEFQTLDRNRLRDTATLIRAKHLQQLPQGAVGAIGTIRGELGKQRRHMPIRKLLDAAGDAVQRLKPVFMMSPISVAQFLKPGRLQFDLLVIDEASQVRPEDALGAIARAKQVVVVGDRKQLPPTSFFDRMVADDGVDDFEDEEGLPNVAKATELESILTLCEARGVPSRMLEWHYRSRDPSLIAVSNDEFYGSRLVMPPSPLQGDPSYGLSFRRVSGAYERGGKRNNRIEAEALVAAVAEHARSKPQLSLGVATFSMSQRDLVGELLEFARRTDHALDTFLRAREGATEDFFVKNLENVQGDERDVIFVSVGYGPMLAGQPLSSMSFGPVNAEGGARRLNVLFTRAKLRCEIFASFDPGEISIERSKSEGVRVLKRFLDFAQTGILDEKRPIGAPADSPFEEMVADAIRAMGYEVDHQVGSAGFRIDLGIRHPDLPGKYILAVECDGATYHSALWARERDRLRQQVLEHLGWQFHRIWSTDWFYRRSDELVRLKARLEEAKVSIFDSGAGAINSEPAEMLVEEDLSGPEAERCIASTPISPPYRVVQISAPIAGEPHEAPLQILATLVRQIVASEGPIHHEEVARRLATAFGKERAGRRILEAAIGALRHAEGTSGGAFCRDGDFWLTAEQKVSPPIRDRSAETGSLAKADMLPPIEIAAAVQRALHDCGATTEFDLVIAVARMLGFRRTGQDLRLAIQRIICHMAVQGQIESDGSAYRMASKRP
jgi:very-short-patch-repair endonuclease